MFIWRPTGHRDTLNSRKRGAPGHAFFGFFGKSRGGRADCENWRGPTSSRGSRPDDRSKAGRRPEDGPKRMESSIRSKDPSLPTPLPKGEGSRATPFRRRRVFCPLPLGEGGRRPGEGRAAIEAALRRVTGERSNAGGGLFLRGWLRLFRPAAPLRKGFGRRRRGGLGVRRRLQIGQGDRDFFADGLNSIVRQILLDQRARLLAEIFDPPFRHPVLSAVRLLQREDPNFIQLGQIRLGRRQVFQVGQQPARGGRVARLERSASAGDDAARRATVSINCTRSRSTSRCVPSRTSSSTSSSVASASTPGKKGRRARMAAPLRTSRSFNGWRRSAAITTVP